VGSSHGSDSNEAVEELSSQVKKLEECTYFPPNVTDLSSIQKEEVSRAHNAVACENIYSSDFKWVPEEYYSFTLSKRADILGAHSTFQLCKSMVMENKSFDCSLQTDASNSQFYLVILQYKTCINNKKLQSEIRALRPVAARLDPSKYDFRVASAEDNARLTGYSHNAVTPFGMLVDFPIILSKSILEYSEMTKFMWMGGGHVHCKLGMAVSDFIKVKKPLILDVTDLRP
jgi:prolyl-tRNA editing enzyme YbaK/EbsC (Cys-tRNA(Pro) deacylase)